ncbi:hypothetical protein G6F57_014052 [Rhizopus arrhizus]|nr:hypothetical protein G6F57_014052 [Rhizopus arrhizus]
MASHAKSRAPGRIAGRAGGCALVAGIAAYARRRGPALDDCGLGRQGQHVARGLRGAVHAGTGRCADGICAAVADGVGQGPAVA